MGTLRILLPTYASSPSRNHKCSEHNATDNRFEEPDCRAHLHQPENHKDCNVHLPNQIRCIEVSHLVTWLARWHALPKNYAASSKHTSMTSTIATLEDNVMFKSMAHTSTELCGQRQAPHVYVFQLHFHGTHSHRTMRPAASLQQCIGSGAYSMAGGPPSRTDQDARLHR